MRTLVRNILSRIFVGGSQSSINLLQVRLTMASLMVHHGLDKLQNAEGFSANVVAKSFPSARPAHNLGGWVDEIHTQISQET